MLGIMMIIYGVLVNRAKQTAFTTLIVIVGLYIGFQWMGPVAVERFFNLKRH